MDHLTSAADRIATGIYDAPDSRLSESVPWRRTTMSPSVPRPLPREDRPELNDLPLQVAKRLSGLFKLLADETRLRILNYLMQTEACNVRQLCEMLGQSQPAVSHHLAILRAASLIDLRRDGKHNYYFLVPQQMRSVMQLLFQESPGAQATLDFAGCVLRFENP